MSRTELDDAAPEHGPAPASVGPPSLETSELARDEPSARPEPGRTAWKVALVWVAVTRAVFFAVSYAAAHYLEGETQGPLSASWIEIWNRWDATLFFRVAEHGYLGEGTDPHSTAFFPLFPFAVKMIAAAGPSFVTAGLIVSTAACVVAFAYLYRLAELELDGDSARRAVAYLALFPAAVFLVAPYSEALFLAGAIPAFYYARKGEWQWVGVPAAVACASRSAGAFLLVGLVFEFVRQKDWSPRRAVNAATSLAVGVLPMVLYGVYLLRAKGDFFYYFTDQKLGWGRDFVGPVASFRATWDAAAQPANPTNWMFAWRMELVAAAIGLAAVVWAVVKREWGYAAYMGTFLFVLVSSTWYYSIPRMLLAFFPIPLVLAAWTARSHLRHEVVLATSAALAIMGSVVYTRGAWFY